jgi:hypothetical protein
LERHRDINSCHTSRRHTPSSENLRLMLIVETVSHEDACIPSCGNQIHAIAERKKSPPTNDHRRVRNSEDSTPAPRVVSMPAPHENSMPTQHVCDCRHSSLARTHCDRQGSDCCILQVCHRWSRCRVDAASRLYANWIEFCYDV